MMELVAIVIISIIIFILVYISTGKKTKKAVVFAALAAVLSFCGQYIVGYVRNATNNKGYIDEVENTFSFEETDLSTGDEISSNMQSISDEDYSNDMTDMADNSGEYIETEYDEEDSTFITFIGESHESSDAADRVDVYDWIKDEDYDLSGRTYNGGVKITISNMFSSIDPNSGISSEIVSESHFALNTEKMEELPEEYLRFNGKFVIGKDTDGSPSTAVISIIVDGEEKYNSGEVNCYSLDIKPFDIDLSGRKEVVIKIVCQRKGNPFIIGIV